MQARLGLWSRGRGREREKVAQKCRGSEKSPADEWPDRMAAHVEARPDKAAAFRACICANSASDIGAAHLPGRERKGEDVAAATAAAAQVISAPRGLTFPLASLLLDSGRAASVYRERSFRLDPLF